MSIGQVCEHGSLARSCLVCELQSQLSLVHGELQHTTAVAIGAEARNVKLEAERDALKAQSAKFKRALEKIVNDKRTPPSYDTGSIHSFFEAIRLEAKQALASQGESKEILFSGQCNHHVPIGQHCKECNR